jgi:hypothetical protein
VEPADVRPVRVRALELLLGLVRLVVPVLVFLEDPEIHQRSIPNAAETHRDESV